MTTRTEWPEPSNNYGTDGDHCPECCSDWRRPHGEWCSQFLKCGYPPGCESGALRGRLVCHRHFMALSALFGPRVDA